NVVLARTQPHLDAIRRACFNPSPAIFQRRRLAKIVGEKKQSEFVSAEIEMRQMKDFAALEKMAGELPQLGVFVNSHGNAFMNEIAELLVNNLQSVGCRANIFDESCDIDLRPPICIFVAPHEFFLAEGGAKWIRDDVLQNAFMFATEQLQTEYFMASLPFLLMSRAVIDICYQNALVLAACSMPTLHFSPVVAPYPASLMDEDYQHPLFAVLPKQAQVRTADISAALSERPIDIAFFGTESLLRDEFFARNAGFLADYATFIHYKRLNRGFAVDAALTRVGGHVLSQSKIALNIHREEFGFFEWHRMVRLAMCAQSVVVSDPCLPQPDFKPGVHFFEANRRQISNVLEWLLKSEKGMKEAERIRRNARNLLCNKYTDKRSALELCQFIHLNQSKKSR